MAHVVHLEVLYRSPIEVEFLRHLADRRAPATLTDVETEALGVERIIGKKLYRFLPHLLTPETVEAADLQFHVHALVAGGEIPHTVELPVVESLRGTSAKWADCFF